MPAKPARKRRTAVERRWWVSWYGSETPFTLHSPWWVSGWALGATRDVPTICAAVIAPDEAGAKRAIVAAHDRAVRLKWRFVNQQPDDWQPFCDRFQRRKWMRWPKPSAGTGVEVANQLLAIQDEAAKVPR